MQTSDNSPGASSSSALHAATPWYSIFQMAGSALGLLMLWSSAFGLAALGLVQGLGQTGSMKEALPVLLMSAGFLLSGALLLPSSYYALLHVLGRPAGAGSQTWRSRLPGILLLLFPLVLILGYLASHNNQIAWLALPPLHVLAVGLPILWLVYLAQRGLPSGSLQRRWGVFSSGLALAPALIILLEIFALAAFIIVIVIFIAAQPGMQEQMRSLSQRLMSDPSDPAVALNILRPFLSNPITILSVLTFGAVFVPLIEESLKPIGVWLLFGKELSPAAGFVAGALSGAGYALFESLTLGSNAGADWAALVVARIGTGIIHILTTALTGWGLACAWREGRYIRLGRTFLLSVSIHGLWNGMTLLNVFSTLIDTKEGMGANSLAINLGALGPFILALMTIGAFLVLLACNWTLRRSESLNLD